LPVAVANQLLSLPVGIRGKTVGLVLLAHGQGMDLTKLIVAAGQLRKLGVLLNQSIRLAKGSSVDHNALQEAVKAVQTLFP